MELAQGQVSSWHSLGRLPLCTAIALVQSSGLAGWGQVPGRAVGHCWPPGGERCRAWAQRCQAHRREGRRSVPAGVCRLTGKIRQSTWQFE